MDTRIRRKKDMFSHSALDKKQEAILSVDGISSLI